MKNRVGALSTDTTKTCIKAHQKVIFGLVFFLCTFILIPQYTFAHNCMIVWAVTGIVLITIGAICSIISALVLSVLVKDINGEKYKKVFYILSILAADFFMYIVIFIGTYVVIKVIFLMTIEFLPSIQGEAIITLIVFLLLVIGSLSVFGVYKLNTLIGKCFFKEENKKRLLRISLIASVLYNPIIVLGIIWLVL